MMGQSKEIYLLLILLFGINHGTQQEFVDLKPTVILISLDGFRYDYLIKHKSENLNNLAKNGVQAKWMIPVFPSLTYPNHYSIATGLYTENHGIVNNTMYDPKFEAQFSLAQRDEVENSRWWQGEPIWVTAEKQGVKSASYFFPGTEAEIAGERPSFWKLYDGTIPNCERVDQILSWVDLPRAERPQFYALYFSDLDDAGHDFSPNSAEVVQAVKKVDADIGRLLDGLRERNIHEKVNVIIVSDHGMAEVKPANMIILDDYFDTTKAERIVWGKQLTSIYPKEGQKEIIYQQLLENTEHVKIYLKEEIPDRFRYQYNRRIAPIICQANEGWIILNNEQYTQRKKYNELSTHLTGAHGYDNQLESMRAIFIANGPAFKAGVVVDQFENVHVYNIIAKILEITPAPNEGSMHIADQVLQSTQ